MPTQGKRTAYQDTLTKSTAALETFFGARSKCGVHPVTRSAFFYAGKDDITDHKSASDELVYDNSFNHDVAPVDVGANLGLRKSAAKISMDVAFEKSNLALMAVFLARESITGQTLSGDTLDGFEIGQRHNARSATVVVPIDVLRADQDSVNLDGNGLWH